MKVALRRNLTGMVAMTEQERENLEREFREKGEQVSARISAIRDRFHDLKDALPGKSGRLAWILGIGTTIAAAALGVAAGSRKNSGNSAPSFEKSSPGKKKGNGTDPVIREAIRAGKTVIVYQPQESNEPDWSAPIKSVASVAVAELITLGADLLTHYLETHKRSTEQPSTDTESTDTGDSSDRIG